MEDPRARAARTKRDRTRRALLDAADSAFGSRGWARTRVEDIAQSAGVSAVTPTTTSRPSTPCSPRSTRRSSTRCSPRRARTSRRPVRSWKRWPTRSEACAGCAPAIAHSPRRSSPARRSTRSRRGPSPIPTTTPTRASSCR
ncbi:MAG: TetR family transcriptional regulator [Pseudonocardia sp.]|nr:TetR family transcriptional regulator [Pseudonocardia sp.]